MDDPAPADFMPATDSPLIFDPATLLSTPPQMVSDAPSQTPPDEGPSDTPPVDAGGETAGEEGGGECAETVGSSTGSVVPGNIDQIAVPKGDAKDGTWFSDAVLIGDSRVDGMRLYGGAGEADYIVRAGMSVYEVDQEKQNISVGGTKYSVYQLLGKRQYAKVYLSIGVNELGYYNPEGYAGTYEKIIEQVRQLQPDAQIYVMTLIPVNSKACQENNQRSYINNELISQYNAALVEMAAEKDVLLVNAAEALAGEDGELLEDMTADGVHFTKDGYVTWKNYLLCHTGT